MIFGKFKTAAGIYFGNEKGTDLMVIKATHNQPTISLFVCPSPTPLVDDNFLFKSAYCFDSRFILWSVNTQNFSLTLFLVPLSAKPSTNYDKSPASFYHMLGRWHFDLINYNPPISASVAGAIPKQELKIFPLESQTDYYYGTNILEIVGIFC